MTFEPQSLKDLKAYWVAQDGTFLGIIGNQRHCKGFHLGKDRIFSDCACKPDGTCEKGLRWADYSVSTARDKAGLTNAAAAIDLGKLRGSLTELYAFSDWLARRCVKGEPDTGDIREVIYSPDGKTVLGFKDGVDFLIPGYGDDSHLHHTHISFYRDSETRDKRAIFRRYFEEAPEDPDVPGLGMKITSRETGSVTVVGSGHSLIRVRDAEPITVSDGQVREYISKVALLVPYDDEPGDRTNGYLVGKTPQEAANVELGFLLASDVKPTPSPTPDTKHTVTLNVDGQTKAEVIV